MEHLDGILKLVDNELEAINKNGKFRSREEIDSVYKLVDIAKDIMCVQEIEDGMDEMSYDGSMSYERRGGSYERGRSNRGGSYEGSYEGGSYARGRRNARRDSMGRYSREYSREGSYRRGYSRDGKEEYVEQLRDLMENAPDDQTRQSVQRMIQQMEQQ